MDPIPPSASSRGSNRMDTPIPPMRWSRLSITLHLPSTQTTPLSSVSCPPVHSPSSRSPRQLPRWSGRPAPTSRRHTSDSPRKPSLSWSTPGSHSPNPTFSRSTTESSHPLSLQKRSPLPSHPETPMLTNPFSLRLSPPSPPSQSHPSPSVSLTRTPIWVNAPSS